MSEWKEFDSWFASEYHNSREIDKLEGSKEYHKFLSTFKETKSTLDGSTRMKAFVRLRYTYPLSNEGYVVSTYKLNTKNASVIIALSYLSSESNQIEYVCISPTYDSRDGEYRRHFMTYDLFQKSYEELLSQLSKIEEKILELISKNEISIDVDFYPKDLSAKAQQTLEKERLTIRLLASTIHLYAESPPQIHTITSFIAAMKDLGEEIAIFSLNPEERGKSYFGIGAKMKFFPEGGQKMIPMTLKAVMEMEDINYAEWRELLIGQIASNLVISGVSQNFPLMNQWMLIEGSDIGLFENKTMHEKFYRSDTTEKSVESLRTARKIIKPEIGSSAAAVSFDAHIHESVEIAQGYLLMSEITLCSTMEHTHTTLGNFPNAYSRSYAVAIYHENFVTNLDHFKKVVFDVLYGAHCLHTKAHVVHSDLHTNNITLHHLARIRKEDNAIEAYVCGEEGEINTYVLPHPGITGCLIDFSRSIVGPGMVDQLTEDYGEDFTRNFYRDQITRILRTFHRYAPTFTEKNQESIKAALLINFEDAFRIMSYVDFISIGASFAHVASQKIDKNTPGIGEVKRNFDMDPRCAEFGKLIEKRAREHFVSHLHDLVANITKTGGKTKVVETLSSPFARKPSRIKFAGHVMFDILFPEFKWKSGIKGTLCDIHNINVPMRYDGRDYDKFPPWARIDVIEKHLGGVKITEIMKKGIKPFLDSLIPTPTADIISETVRAEQEKLDAELGSAVATSSWIE
jgi:hypothetical protein